MKDIPFQIPAALLAANGPARGAPGAGKTNHLARLIGIAAARHVSVVVIDHKGSRTFRDQLAHLMRLLNEGSEK